MRELVYRVLFPFGGSGLGARGFLDASVTLPSFGVSARFECVGGIDLDPLGCEDFHYLTGTPELCADVESLTVDDVRKHFGEKAPHCVFFSPPCKAASGLLSAAKAATPKYQKMNMLALVWTRLMLTAWADDPPPLVLLENVPRLKTRAAPMLKQVRKLLRGAGYVLTDGFHDCGVLGGLAQHRRRYLLVARHPKRCPPVLYQPPAKRVRGCGEVLGQLPVPATPAATEWGRMHELPRLSWLNWVRLALIPAGGDWRDLEGVLAEGQARREAFKRHAVEPWDAPTGTVGGSGSNGVANVADPRITDLPPGVQSVGPGWHPNVLGVKEWDQPSGTVTGEGRITNGSFAVADPRAGSTFGHDKVSEWAAPLGTITTSPAPSSGAGAVADPRIGQGETWGGGRLGVMEWAEPAGVVAGQSLPGNGRYAVADPRLTCAPRAGAYEVRGWEAPAKTVSASLRVDNGPAAVADPRFTFSENAHRNKYAVRSWDGPGPTVIGATRPGSGAPSIADPRLTELLPVERAYDHGYGVLRLDEPSPTVAAGSYPGQGAYAVAEPRDPPSAPHVRVMSLDEALAVDSLDPRKPPPFIPVIVASDGTWHRPLTTLELAALQGFPLVVNGQPLKLAGTSQGKYRERVGNAVPAPAARAIAEKMLTALAESSLGAFSLSGDAVWVRPDAEARS